MKLSFLLLAVGVLCNVLSQSAVQAEEIALSFDLPKVQLPTPQPSPPVAPPETTPDSSSQPLPVPIAAANPPSNATPGSMPKGIYDGTESLAMAEQAASTDALLPPPPSLSEPPKVAINPGSLPAPAPSPVGTPDPPTPVTAAVSSGKPDEIALTFDLGPSAAELAIAAVKSAAPEATPAKSTSFATLFEGGSDSLVARAVGSAEGTRTAQGQRTDAFYGHVDPGNGVWNLGTFSYQHGAASPEEADERQLKRLQAQSRVIRQKAQDYGLELSLEETLNGIDLANQAPLAALGKGSYIDRLFEAHKLGMTGKEAIVWARTRAFLDPDTQRWNAPGLGNTVHSISQDQERRMHAIARALEHYQTQKPDHFSKIVAAAILPSQPTGTQATQPVTETLGDTPSASTPVADFAATLPLDPSIAPGLDSAPSQPTVPLPGVSPLGLPPQSPSANSAEELVGSVAPEAAKEGAQNLTVEAQPEAKSPDSNPEMPIPTTLAEKPLSFDEPTEGESTRDKPTTAPVVIPGATPETHVYTPTHSMEEIPVTPPQL
ncbi:MAG TPA: hypothetical protein V6D07_06180 [Trichocoleus sp.]